MVCTSDGDDPNDTNHTPLKTMTKKQGKQQSSSSNQESSKSNFLAPTGWGALNGAGASIATEILDDALVLMKNTKYGKYYDRTRLAIESTAGLILNEGLEVSKDQERGFWGDGYLDFAEDVALTIGGNYAGTVLATLALGASASVLATAAIGIATASVIGGVWSLGKSLMTDYFSDSENTETTNSLGSNGVAGAYSGSENQSQHEHHDTYYLYSRSDSGSFDDSLSLIGPSNNDQQADSNTELTDNEKAQMIADYLTEMREEDGTFDEEEDFEEDYEEQESEEEQGQSGSQSDEDSDYEPSGESDLEIKATLSRNENPIDDGGDTSDYNGEYDWLKGFSGDIDYGPDGKPGKGYRGEHDVLSGFNPRIDYGPEGKPGQDHNGEYDELIGFNPRIDWDQDHTDHQEFEGNALTKRLGEINPRVMKEALERTKVASTSRQANTMSRIDSAFIFDSQSGDLYHNANGSAKGFGSGGAVAEIDIDQDLSLVAIDFL